MYKECKNLLKNYHKANSLSYVASLVKNILIPFLIFILFAIFIFSLIPTKSHAGTFAADAGNGNVYRITPEENICFLKAAKMYHVPIDILKSIAKIESNYNPYAINVEGASYMPDNIVQAWQIIRSNYYKSFDIGIMQINNSWFKMLNIPYWYGFNTCYNIMLGAYVLRKKIDTFGNNWFGIAAYHSADPMANNRYAWLLWKHLKKISG